VLIRQELQALRGDDAPQRQAQRRIAEATGRWRESSGAALADAELACLADGAPLEDLPFLAALFTPGDPGAGEFVDSLIAAQAAELAAEPLAQVIWRHHVDDGVTTLIVARHGMATLTLQSCDGTGLARIPAAVTIGFSPGETWEHVLAGTAEADLVRIVGERPGGADLVRAPLQLAPGTVSHRHCAREAQLLRSVPSSLVSLKLQRRLGRGGVTRHFRLDDGRLVHQSAGCPRDSRLELTAALLGRMGRSDAAPLLAAMAEEEAAVSLRWQALRECLALDSAQGFATLCRIALRDGDPLAAPAGALRAQLLEAHPGLHHCQGETSPCPA